MAWVLEMIEKTGSVLLIIVVPIVFSGVIGYFFGVAKFFREQKQKAYGELLPPIVRMAYASADADEAEFSEALMKLWLYGSKKVVGKMDHAVWVLHDRRRGNRTAALQKAIVAMRADIQLWSWQKLGPEDVQHLYSRIAGK